MTRSRTKSEPRFRTRSELIELENERLLVVNAVLKRRIDTLEHRLILDSAIRDHEDVRNGATGIYQRLMKACHPDTHPELKSILEPIAADINALRDALRPRRTA